jgi:hypothetical protein
MSTNLEIKQIGFPEGMPEATSYGSGFSRGTLVSFENPGAGLAKLLFLSGTASIDAKGQVVAVGDLAAQKTRKWYNINGVFRSAGMELRQIVHAATYIKPEHAPNGTQSASTLDNSHDLYLSDVCRDGWLTETDALAVDNQSGLDLSPFCQAYADYHRMAMRGSTKQTERIISVGDLDFLLLYDFAKADKSVTELTSTEYNDIMAGLFERLTTTLTRDGRANWRDVVDTRFNLGQFLAHPHDIKSNGPNDNYYTLCFNPVRTEVYQAEGVGAVRPVENDHYPNPSSTGIFANITQIPDNFVAGVEVVAVYQAR